MTTKQVAPGVYMVSLGIVNSYLIDHDELTLIDTGIPGSERKISKAVREIGRRPEDIRQILVTHCHVDHSGSLAVIKRMTGAPATMHALDATMVRQGQAMRPMQPVGLPGRLMVRMLRWRGPVKIEAAEIEHEVTDGDELPIAGGLQVVHVPGHCAGQLAFLWPRHGGVLFAADAAGHMPFLGLSPIYEDVETGRRSLQKLSALQFEIACFGHGRPIRRRAAERFRRKWSVSAGRESVRT